MRLVPVLGWGIAFFALVLAVPVSADTLVQKAGDSYKPLLAKSWNGSGTVVSFTLQQGVDGDKLAKTLGQRLKGAQVTFTNGQLTIAGVPMQSLLEQLSLLNVEPETDPLAELASLGGASASSTHEGGGSIRAARPASDIPFPTDSSPTELGAHDAKERLSAQVIEVHRSVFPQVSLKLRITRAAEAGEAKAFKRGRTLTASVVFAGGAGLPDLQQVANQRNLAGFYLAAGDRISLHIAPSATPVSSAPTPTPGSPTPAVSAAPAPDQVLAIDWLERQ